MDIDPELTAGLRILFVKKNLMKDSDTSNDRSDNNGDGGSCDSDSCNSDSIEAENIKNISETDIKNTDNIAVAEEKINANATKAEKSVSEDEYTNATNAYSNNKGKEKIKRLTRKNKKILKDDSCKAALNKIKTELINLLKAIMPYKLYLKAEFSAGSPDKTGMVLGILAMFPIGYRNKWKIRPDFEREEIYIDSEFDIKGHIFLYKILVIAIRVLVDKNCRKLYNEIRK